MNLNWGLIFYSVFTLYAWIVSLIWLLPFLAILKFSKNSRDRWFSWFYVSICQSRMGNAMSRMRKVAFDRLKEEISNREGEPLEFLEIGVGGGANLPNYPDKTSLTVVDTNSSFMTCFVETLQKYPNITLKNVWITSAEDMIQIDNDAFDVIVCTYTLCSVENLPSALKEIKRVLKPGGKFLSLEHVPYPSSSWTFTLQRFAAPLWKILFNGCDLTRNTEEEIKKTGFIDVEYQRFHPVNMWLFTRKNVIALATK